MPNDRTWTRVSGNRLGWLVLLAWGLTVSMAFGAIFADSHASTTASALTAPETALIGSWIAASPDYRPGRTTIVWLPDAGCACKRMQRGQWQRLGARWGRRNTALHEMSAPAARPATLSHVEIVVVDATGRPVYAGAFDDTAMCGDATAMDVIVATAHALPPPLPTRSSPRTCECP